MTARVEQDSVVSVDSVLSEFSSLVCRLEMEVIAMGEALNESGNITYALDFTQIYESVQDYRRELVQLNRLVGQLLKKMNDSDTTKTKLIPIQERILDFLSNLPSPQDLILARVSLPQLQDLYCRHLALLQEIAQQYGLKYSMQQRKKKT